MKFAQNEARLNLYSLELLINELIIQHIFGEILIIILCSFGTQIEAFNSFLKHISIHNKNFHQNGILMYAVFSQFSATFFSNPFEMFFFFEFLFY